MQFANIVPGELKALRQWVVWRIIENEQGKFTKPPFQPRNFNIPASVTDPSTWGSFAEAVACWQANASTVAGVGFVFTEQDEFFGIDIDDIAKVAPEHVAARRALEAALFAQFDTYTEWSPSGRGVHLIGRGRLPVKGRRDSRLQVEFYNQDRFFTITGNPYLDRTIQIMPLQAAIDEFFAGLPTRARAEQSVHDTTEGGRRLDLPDEEVLRLCAQRQPRFADRYLARVGCEPGIWSDTFMMVVGELDIVSGCVAQVERLIYTSPMVQSAPPAADGEARIRKAFRTFPDTLAKVRGNNTVTRAEVERGRLLWEGVERAKAERAALAAEAVRAALETVGKMSQGSISLIKAFPQLGAAAVKLTRPPGVVGRFVEATEMAMPNPFLKYAIPATLVSLAGVVARGYKLPNGNGLNINCILAAPSASGKTQSMNAWQGFMDHAAGAIGNTLSGPSRSRIINAGTSSIQGIFDDFMSVPCCAWFIEECGAQLSKMNDPKSGTDEQLRDAYNSLYDAGTPYALFQPPRSVAQKKANMTPIQNLCVSTYWSTVPNKFDVFGADALDGFLSRVVVIRHSGRAGDLIHNAQRYLPADLHDMLTQMLARAKALDETYAMAAATADQRIVTVSTDVVRQLQRELQTITETIKHSAHEGKLPPAYVAIARVPMTALRIAGILAVFENPNAPVITVDEYTWAFGWLLQNMASVLSDMDTGELGDTASDETLCVVRGVKELIGKHKGAPGAQRGALLTLCKHRSPFGVGTNRSKRVSETIQYMLMEGMLEEVTTPPDGKPGRPPTYLAPTSHDVWNT